MTKLNRLPETLGMTGLSRSKLYELIEQGRFPKPVKLSGRINAWTDTDISEYIAARIAERETA